jgi:hypothetical protein
MPDTCTPSTCANKNSIESTSTGDWQPIFNVNANDGEEAILMLIYNNGIVYPNASLDPIFFANTTDDGKWYFNTRYHASVLGCLSRTAVCVPPMTTGFKSCYTLDAFGARNTTQDDGSAADLLFFSLIPQLEHQLFFLQAEALQAQSLSSGSISAQLPNGQWKVEVQHLFESLLARIQITTRNMARGARGVKMPDQRDMENFKWRGVCTRYKFRSIGWKNISVTHFLVEFLLGLLVCFLGITTEDKKLWVERPARWIGKSRFGQMCAIGAGKMKEWWDEYAPLTWGWVHSSASTCWDAVCNLSRDCWRGMLDVVTFLGDNWSKLRRRGETT